MREILFRGKDYSGVINHSWCFGSLDITEKEHPIVIYPDRFGNKCNIFVNPETVGQYTGLTDKNGKKIFEGDIIDTFDRLIKVVWLEGNAQFDLNFVKFAHNKRIVNFRGIEMRDLHSYEVIGNIHDNPELLKGE